MKRLYAKNFPVDRVFSDPIPGAIELIPLPAGSELSPDWTDPDGSAWVAIESSAREFRDLCDRTGMKKNALAEKCGKTPASFSAYLSGRLPAPRLVFEKVKRIADAVG